MVRQIIEKAIKQGKGTHLCFIDLEKALDKVKRDVIWKCMERGIDNKLIEAGKNYYRKTRNYIQTNNEESKEFETTEEVRQGCLLSPLLFNIVMDEVIKDCHTKNRWYEVGFWKMELVKISELAFADDVILIAKQKKTLTTI